MALRIVADRNIAFAAEAFAPLGDVVTLPSGELVREAVRDADLVLVRSTVKVGAPLLDGSRARFVATATIGTDHLDTAWLDARGIRWASAPGSNADSVLEWWAAALLTIAERRSAALASLRVGIVGVGAVGGRVERFCRALGVTPLLCDPPRARRESETDFTFAEKSETHFTSLDALLPACDVVTFHVPLTREGEDATHHLLDERRLGALAPGAWLVNASRGEVVDGAALERALAAGRPAQAILDVWEGEPSPAPSLIERCALATPHIAGHSLDGKANGTEQIYRAACAFLGVAPSWRARAALPPPASPSLRLDTAGRSDEAIVLAALRAAYRIETDDAALRAIARLPPGERAAAFRRHRDHYPARRELRAFTVELSPPRPSAARILTTLGANVQS
ncbi:MAG TPA: 4-phosphoerythronate dehydrogenase [Polyangia bacterium]|nr:4-phosphoerythronate dehydrogenase [Polyangia bacterium]